MRGCRIKHTCSHRITHTPHIPHICSHNLLNGTQVVGLLSDPELPVRVDAVVSLRQFIDHAEDIEPLKPLLPTLLNAIFQLMGQVGRLRCVWSCLCQMCL